MLCWGPGAYWQLQHSIILQFCDKCAKFGNSHSLKINSFGYIRIRRNVMWNNVHTFLLDIFIKRIKANLTIIKIIVIGWCTFLSFSPINSFSIAQSYNIYAYLGNKYWKPLFNNFNKNSTDTRYVAMHICWPWRV